MVSDQKFYLREEGQVHWKSWDDHPARPLEGIVSLWGDAKNLEDGTKVKIVTYLGGPETEIIYKKEE